jgi:hypothetical protein
MWLGLRDYAVSAVIARCGGIGACISRVALSW